MLPIRESPAKVCAISLLPATFPACISPAVTSQERSSQAGERGCNQQPDPEAVEPRPRRYSRARACPKTSQGRKRPPVPKKLPLPRAPTLSTWEAAPSGVTTPATLAGWLGRTKALREGTAAPSSHDEQPLVPRREGPPQLPDAGAPRGRESFSGSESPAQRTFQPDVQKPAT